MFEYRITFGIGERADGSAINEHEQRAILDTIERFTAVDFGGYNLTFGQGGWVNPAGRLVREQSATLSIITDNPELVRDHADVVRYEVDQHSVILIHPDGSAEFIEA